MLVGSATAQDTLAIVKSFQTIDPVAAYFRSATLPDSTQFGVDVVGMGDIDRDGVPDLAVGTAIDSIGYTRGSAVVLFMNRNGTVRSSKRISPPVDSLDLQLDVGDGFGRRVANIGDLNGDGMADMAVLAAGDDDGGTDHGAVYILFLDTAATVIGYQKISDTEGGFTGTMTNGNAFNSGVTEVGDMDGDGVQDIAVGADASDDGGTAGSARGALWILLMNRNGTVKGHRKYSRNATSWPGYPTSPLASGSRFGFATAKLGDLDKDGYNDIAVCARRQGYQGTGLIYILFLNSSGGIKSFKTIGRLDATTNLGGLKTMLTGNGGQFGWSMDNMGDLNGDGVIDLAIGMNMQSDGFTQAGAALIAYMKTDGTLQHEDLISHTTSSLGLHASTWFGTGVAAIGDLDGDHVMDLAVGAKNYGTGPNAWKGRVFILDLNAKPLRVMSTTTQDATLTTAGKAKLDIKGGIRPYRLVWMDSIPTSTR
ncbi:MAG: VCBS repeat-containing protein, partial [Bacteroidetes bacterium]|nr:VCBS repeat-containing protein [Bacteroidota bacterium]